MPIPPLFPRRTLVSFVLLAVLTAPVAAFAESNPRVTPLVRALRKARHAVVNIHSQKTARNNDTLFGPTKPRKVNGMGTGVVIDPRGYIVTNHHVVDGVDALRVTLFGGGTYTASVVTYDREHDLAIIKIKPGKKLPVMTMGTSSDLMWGEKVFAVGNAYGYENTVTSGIISALSRDVVVNEKQSYKDLIQTDASINPGNSGGPLININGEVIGINVAIRAGAQRIGFAIPIDDARRIVAKLMAIERLDGNYHGLQTRDLKSGKRRELVVSTADSNSPAAAAGFHAGDVIVKVGDVKVTDRVDLERALHGRRIGEPVPVIVRRSGSNVKMAMKLTRSTKTTVVRANNDASSSSSTVTSSTNRVWSALGVQLSKVRDRTKLAGSRYRGGMRVISVRRNSPAARNGIRTGDILVGLHIWETVNPENVSYVLSHPRLSTFNPLKFYIVRKGETLYGHVRLATTP